MVGLCRDYYTVKICEGTERKVALVGTLCEARTMVAAVPPGTQAEVWRTSTTVRHTRVYRTAAA